MKKHNENVCRRGYLKIKVSLKELGEKDNYLNTVKLRLPFEYHPEGEDTCSWIMERLLMEKKLNGMDDRKFEHFKLEVITGLSRGLLITKSEIIDQLELEEIIESSLEWVNSKV